MLTNCLLFNTAIENDIHMKSDQISLKLDRLDMFVNKEHFSRRQIYRM